MNMQTEAWSPAATAGIGFSRNMTNQGWAKGLDDQSGERRHKRLFRHAQVATAATHPYPQPCC